MPVKNAPINPPPQTIQAVVDPDSIAPARISSLDSGKKPIRAIVPTHISLVVWGMTFDRPPIRRTSCSLARAWMTMPAPRNSRALKNAWVSRWNMPAAYSPTPTAANM